MTKYLSRFLLVCVFVTASCFVNASESSAPAFWKVSKGEGKVYLLGSMHFGRADFYPLPPEIEEAFAESSRLAVELDISAISPSDAMQGIFKHAALPLGTTLKTALKPVLYEQLTARCKLNNLPVSAFDNFQPWFVAMQLVEAEIKKTDLKQLLGVEMYFLGKGGKKIDPLETLDSQLGLFSQFSVDEQQPFLEQTLIDLVESQKYLTLMADGWRDGDMDILEKQLIAPFRENKSNKKLFNSLFTLRNIEMTKAVERYLKGSESVFFVVGAGHMIGKEGIVDLLTKKGYRVDRVSFSKM